CRRRFFRDRLISHRNRACRGRSQQGPEQYLNERPDRPDAPPSLGPEDRPLPTAEAELGHRVDVQVGPKLAGLLSLPQARGTTIAPRPEDRLEPQAERLALIGHLLAQIANQTAIATPLGLESGADLLEIAPQPLQGPPARVAQATGEPRGD